MEKGKCTIHFSCAQNMNVHYVFAIVSVKSCKMTFGPLFVASQFATHRKKQYTLLQAGIMVGVLSDHK